MSTLYPVPGRVLRPAPAPKLLPTAFLPAAPPPADVQLPSLIMAPLMPPQGRAAP